MVVLQSITKNAEFKVGFSLASSFTSLQAPTLIKVSKDGGDFATATNPAVLVSAAGDWFGNNIAYTCTLTATEMNADLVIVAVERAQSSGAVEMIFIYTGSASGGATAQEVWEYATRTLTSSGSSGMSLDDTIDIDVDAPIVGCTVEGLLAILVRRLKRGSQKL